MTIIVVKLSAGTCAVAPVYIVSQHHLLKWESRWTYASLVKRSVILWLWSC